LDIAFGLASAFAFAAAFGFATAFGFAAAFGLAPAFTRSKALVHTFALVPLRLFAMFAVRETHFREYQSRSRMPFRGLVGPM
jgi:hypothetical protein